MTLDQFYSVGLAWIVYKQIDVAVIRNMQNVGERMVVSLSLQDRLECVFGGWSGAVLDSRNVTR